MSKIAECCQSVCDTNTSKNIRISVMFILMTATALAEIVYGIRTKANSLIADGLYSFAEALCLIGVIIVLHYSQNVKHHKRHNTFGYERLELLFGLIQEVFLLSISLGVIVNAINHLINPTEIHDPMLMIVLGVSGIFIGVLGMLMFYGYHHDHNIKKEIKRNKTKLFVNKIKKDIKAKQTPSTEPVENAAVETSVMIEQSEAATTVQSDISVEPEHKAPAVQENKENLEAFTYEHVLLVESRIYATLHAIYLHSTESVVLIESCIVLLSGLTIYLIPHHDAKTGKEINSWVKYIDPSLTLVMVAIVFAHAIPVIFSISKVLIESVPAGIDTRDLMEEIIKALPAIQSIHSFHVWRVTAKDIYASLHAVCNDDIILSTCTNDYGRKIENIFKNHCIRHFTVQFEYTESKRSTGIIEYPCVYGLQRLHRGHHLDASKIKLAEVPLPNNNS